MIINIKKIIFSSLKINIKQIIKKLMKFTFPNSPISKINPKAEWPNNYSRKFKSTKKIILPIDHDIFNQKKVIFI